MTRYRAKLLTPNYSDCKRNCRQIAAMSTPYYGYIVAPNILSDNDILNALRYGDNNDKQFAQLIEWYELERIQFDKTKKHVMCWGSKENVADAIEGITQILSDSATSIVTLLQIKTDIEHIRRKNDERDMCDHDEEYYEKKHM